MKLEHLALNVTDPIAIAGWYVQHLGMQIVKQQQQTPFTMFLADDSGQMLIEIYTNEAAPVPDYVHMHPLVLHLAFVSQFPDMDAERLIAAGATLVENLQLEDGSQLVMLRDPWGLCLQLCRRTNALVKQ